MTANVWERLRTEVVEAGLCTHCGSCVGLSAGQLMMAQTEYGPLPTAVSDNPDLPPLAYQVCPGKGVDYPHLYQQQFGQLPANWLLGCYRQVWIGYASRPEIRRQGASGGVITQTLLYLLEQGLIDGAVVACLGRSRPWLAEPMIARTPAEILAAAQSIYQPVPVNQILDQMAAFAGRLAYVGLPDQVASLRQLQAAGHPGATKVEYVLGPYVGTNMYLGALTSFLRSHGASSLEEIESLNYREGEWPGYLQIRLRNGRVLKAEKFYYNYLIPFYITRSSWLAVDFTNELTDISVGDAWHPRYEAQGTGFSVVVARSRRGETLLQEMAAAQIVVLDEIAVDEALAMHGHMLDFKKRGTFIRTGWQQRLGRPIPRFGYRPTHIPAMRYLTELVIMGLFWVCGTRPARRLVEFVPLRLLGPLFNRLRLSWKQLSKPVKRKGLANVDFVVEQWQSDE
jgi:coenzyme F420 hydrogenase subunit beta